MSNFDELSNMPGVTHRVYCSMCACREATGEIEVYVDKDASEETFQLPICESCFQAALDMSSQNVLD